MSYYGAKGDFYTGRTGYYRGDPGFFSSLGGIVKGVAGGLVKSYTGIDLFGSGAGSAAGPTNFMSQQPTISAAASASKRGMTSQPGRRRSLSGAVSTSMPTMGRLSPSGPLASRGMPAMRAGGSVGRRSHRMNVTNPRALRRAIRRTHGFAKLAMKTIHLVHPKKRATFGGFRRKRRK